MNKSINVTQDKPLQIKQILMFMEIIFGISGGFLTAEIGSGADIAFYIYSLFIYNKSLEKKDRLGVRS